MPLKLGFIFFILCKSKFKMQKKFLKYLICPICKGKDLSTEGIESKSSQDYIENGKINCKNCENSFPIKNSVPYMIDEVGSKFPEMSFNKQWMLKKCKLLEPNLSSGKMPQERYQKILKTFNLKSFPDGSKFFDAGCGNGINGLEVARNNQNCLVFMTDVTYEGVIETKKKSLGLENVFVVQSDLMNLVFEEEFFDFVWCEGVLHHTPNTYEALKSLNRSVKIEGMLYIWLYPSYRKSYYLLIRDIFFMAHKFPFWLIYLLSLVLAFPYYLFNLIFISIKKMIFPKTAPLLKKRPYLSVVFSTYDSLNPKYQYRHSKEEAKAWLVNLGFESIRVVGDLGLVAKKQK